MLMPPCRALTLSPDTPCAVRRRRAVDSMSPQNSHDLAASIADCVGGQPEFELHENAPVLMPRYESGRPRQPLAPPRGHERTSFSLNTQTAATSAELRPMPAAAPGRASRPRRFEYRR